MQEKEEMKKRKRTKYTVFSNFFSCFNVLLFSYNPSMYDSVSTHGRRIKCYKVSYMSFIILEWRNNFIPLVFLNVLFFSYNPSVYDSLSARDRRTSGGFSSLARVPILIN